MKIMDGQLYTLKDICKLTGYHFSTIYRMIARDEFPKPVKIGVASRWPKEDFDAWRAKCLQNAA